MRTKFIFVCTLVVILVIQAGFSTGYPIKSNGLRILLDNSLMKVSDCVPYESNKRIIPLRFRRSNNIRKKFECIITLK